MYKSPLHQTVATTDTDLWNDSCAIGELTYVTEHGAVETRLRSPAPQLA